MTATFPTIPSIIGNTPTRTNIEPWFIPMDILVSVCLALVIVFVTSLLCIIALDKTCHTLSMLLMGNSYLAQLIFACTRFGSCLFSLKNDLEQVAYQDSLCAFRNYLTIASASAMYYSFLLQAVYRYITVVHSTRLFWQSVKFQSSLVCFTWMFSFVYPFAFLFTGDIVYNADNQICEPPLRLSFFLICSMCCAYLIPIAMIMAIYFKLFRYVKEMGKHVVVANALLRAQRELKMVQQTVIVMIVLLVLGTPYLIFWLISFFTTPPKFHFRIAFLFVDLSLTFVPIISLKFSEMLKASVKKILTSGRNMVLPMAA